jgi:hypothetical protein
MLGMRVLTAAAAAMGLLSGCLMRESNAYNVESFPHQWSIPGPDWEHKVFGPMPSEEVKDFVRARESEGWEVIGYEPASAPEDVMVNQVELDRLARAKHADKRGPWTFDIPKTMDDGVDPPKKPSIPPYLDEGVKPHRQKYLVIMRRWL